VGQLARRLARLAGALAGLLLIVLAVLHLPSVRSRVLDRARLYAQRELGVELRVSRLRYNVLTRSIELRDVSLAAAPDASPFLEADSASIVLGPALFRGQVMVERVALSRPRVTIIRHADGMVNLPESKNTGQQAGPLQLGVVSVSAASLRLEDRLARRSFTAGPFDLSLDTGDAAGPPGTFGPVTFKVRAGPVETSGTIAGRLGFDGTRVRIDELTVDTNEGRAIASGWADVVGERPTVAMLIKAALELPKTARLADVNARGLTGRLEATVDIAGPLASPAVTLTLASRDASYAGGSLNMDGTVALAGATPPASRPGSRVALGWTNVRVDELAQALGRSLPVRTGSLASGSGTVEFNVADLQARAWSRLRVAARASLQAMHAAAADSLALSGNADLDCDAGRWSLRHTLNARHGSVDVGGTVNGRLLDRVDGSVSTLGGRTRVRIPDLGVLPSLTQMAGVTLPPRAADGLSGSIAAIVDVGGTIQRPAAQVALDARQVRTGALPDTTGTVDALLTIDTNGVDAQQVRAAAGTTSLNASGKYAWRGPFDARVELNEADLSAFATRFALPVAINGSGGVTATIAGAISNAGLTGQAVLTLSASDVAIDDVAIGLVTAKGTLPFAAGSVMTVEAAAPAAGAHADLEIVNRPGYPASGEITLEHDNVPALIPARYREQLPGVSGALSATARGSGHLSDPAGIRGRVDVRRLDAMVEGARVRLSAPGSVTMTDDRVAVDALDFRVGESTRVTLTGALGRAVLAQPLRLRVDGPLSELIAIGSRVGGAASVPVQGDGTATLDVSVGGTLARPQPTGTLALRSPSLQYGAVAPLTDLTLDAVIDPTFITLRAAEARWQDASVRGDGTLPWRVVLSAANHGQSKLTEWLNTLPAEPSRAQFTFRADNLTHAMLEGVIDAERVRQVQANGSASLVVDADRFALEAVRATAVLDSGSVTLAGVPFAQSVPTRVRLEKGQVSIESFQWTAQNNSIFVKGGANLVGAEPRLDLGISGVLDLRVASAFAPGIRSGGTANAGLSVAGSLDNPEIVGRITVADGELQLDRPRVAASDLNGTVQIAAGRKASISIAGQVNTGSATLEGTIDLGSLAQPTGRLRFNGRDVAFEYPPGLQTNSNVNLELALGASSSTVTGRVDVLDGTYREALVLSTQVLNFSSTGGIARAAPAAEWLSRIRLNIAVATASDVRIDNNYGRFDVGATFRIAGTAARPGVLGRLQAAEDGEIYLGGNTYRIERLEVDLTNPRAMTPEVNFSAVTRIGDLPIGLELTCPPSGACERKVTSLRTGVDDVEAEERLFGTAANAASAGEGLVRLLSGEFLGVVGRTVGLDSIRLEQEAQRRDIFDDPTLISGDVDPATRLTLAKRLGSSVELVFSQNLADDGFTWIASYSGPFGLSWRLLLLDDQSRSYEFRHEPSLGAGSRRRTRPPGPRITALTVGGTPGFPEPEIRRQLELTEGDRFEFGGWQRDRDRLARFYRDRGFLEARIRTRRSSVDQTGVTLEYTIVRGPASELEVRGATIPKDVRARVSDRWTSALFDGFLERDARTIVREHLYRNGYLDAKVTTAIAQDARRERKTLTIDVVPGSSMASRIELTGNTGLPTEDLRAVVTATDALAPWLDPASVERLLEDHYRAEGFLAADVSVAPSEVRDGASVVTIKVSEGSAYSIGRVELTGLPELPKDDTSDAAALVSGDRYRPASVAESINRLETRLRRAAYRQASAEVDTRVDDETARVDISVRVAPGPRSILRDVVVEGADAGTPLVARSIVLAPDAPIDPSAIRETRRRLYDLDLYRSVDIQIQPLSPAAPPAAPGPPLEQPVVARIMVEERPRYRFRYGLAVSDEEIGPDERDQRLGFASDFETRNIFGLGAGAGFSLRLRRDQQVGRVTLGARRLFGLPIRSTLFLERERERLNPEGALPITSNITALAVEEAYRVANVVELRHGFRSERNRTVIDADLEDPFDIKVKIARFTTSGLVDRRDDAFNPARGWFASSTVELSTPNLGSDLKFLKDFSQYSQFVRIGGGLVVASAARLGLARTFGDQVLIPSERFYAGGANSVRGYREDDLGERSVFDDAEGGSALLVLNGELRFPVYRWLSGVGFVDLGNVYPTVGDISFADLQIGIGAGARFDTPFGLFRFDFGVPANRRSFDPRWRVHFGLGHAF
jgi:outer membrane protein insertion porin family